MNLTHDAQTRLDAYLANLRATLARCKTVDAVEIERDILDHIEAETQDTPHQISVSHLNTVLDKLGKPEQWLPPGEVSWWDKIINRFRTGPEDWRLAYMSVVCFTLGFIFPPLWIAGYIISRSLLARNNDSPFQTQPQKWLYYPCLIIIQTIVTFIALFWILVPAIAIVDEFYRDIIPYLSHYMQSCEHVAESLGLRTYDVLDTALIVFTVTASLGAWWLLLSISLAIRPKCVRAFYHPFAQNFSSLKAFRLTILSLLFLATAYAIHFCLYS